ncbi:MAG: YafY family protein [Candidatus Obscuribacterales bacterium]|nr:YafY family protein [Candidatus Obscuribacterales bacterium]
MNRVDRLLAIILHIQLRRGTSVDELAREFNLTVRTIYRDLIAIGEAGVPLVFEAKRGYSIAQGYSLPPVNLTEAEALALTMGRLLVDRLVDSSIRQNLETAAEKIKSVLPAKSKEDVQRLERAMAITAVPVVVEQTALTELQKAILQNSVVRFVYQKPEAEPESRTADPMGLIHYLARWHLIAWCHKKKALRDFRTDRISALVITNEKFEREADFDASEFLRKSMPSASLIATVRFDAVSVDRAKREWWLGIVGEEQIAEGTILQLATVDWLWLARWLFTFSNSVVVLEPNEFKQILKLESAKLSEHYS